MQVIIDRFEGEYAVLESEKRVMKRIRRQELPDAAREGDVLIQKNKKWIIDIESSIKRKKRMEALAAELWENE
ncbi:MAG: DUF3006 domain-containing protein [Syntrophomonadaceae bacterium]|nr:DUF3006 domain-containing protein [Syntrophomonadaceae bacterium]MDD3022443.1 DUF3006 domain-containing protein [Syntrophomonadaceae bacterium]